MSNELATAVRGYHDCQDNTCDIRAALQQGFSLVAAQRLFGATDGFEVCDPDGVKCGECISCLYEAEYTVDDLKWEEEEFGMWFRANSAECGGCNAWILIDDWTARNYIGDDGNKVRCDCCGYEGTLRYSITK